MIDNLREDLSNIWNGLSNQWKATIRTGWQSVVGAFLVGLLALLGSVTNLVNGGDVDLWQEASNAARLFALASLGALSGVVAFVMNRNDPPQYGDDR